jgi:hypothetical protein
MPATALEEGLNHGIHGKKTEINHGIHGIHGKKTGIRGF